MPDISAVNYMSTITALTATLHFPSENLLIGYISSHTRARVSAVYKLLSDFKELAKKDPKYTITQDVKDALYLINSSANNAIQFENNKNDTLEMYLDFPISK